MGSKRRRSVALTAGCVLAIGALPLLIGPASAQTSGPRDIRSGCGEPRTVFDDVPPSSPHHAGVHCVERWDVTAGRTASTYAPAAPVTRAQMATFLVRVVEAGGGDVPDDAPNAFDDDDGSVHEDNIDRLAEMGLASRGDDRRFRPGATVRRDQMASFLARTAAYLRIDLPDGDDAFTDDDGNVHEARIDQVAAAGIAAGVTATSYQPAGLVDRGRMATFLARLVDLLVDELELEVPPDDAPPAGTSFVQVVHAVPSDQQPSPGLVEAARHEIGLIDGWYRGQTGGLGPRWRRSGDGTVDVRVVTLDRTRAQLEDSPSTFDETLASLQRAGLVDDDDVFLTYVEVVDDFGCGSNRGAYSFLWMPTCDIRPSTQTPSWPYGATYLTAHELTHGFGAVPTCAPNHGNGGHVIDDNRDVLYAGPDQRDWDNLMLDPGHDDYYGHGRSDCTDIADHPVWTP